MGYRTGRRSRFWLVTGLRSTCRAIGQTPIGGSGSRSRCRFGLVGATSNDHCDGYDFDHSGGRGLGPPAWPIARHLHRQVADLEGRLDHWSRGERS